MKTILAVIDFSPVTTRLVAEAVALARKTGARLVLLNVTTTEGLAYDYALLESLLEGTDPETKSGTRSRGAPSIQGRSLQLVGKPVPVILQQAEQDSADYIMLGSHGHSKLFNVLVGSTAAGVIAGARCPVIVIPAWKPSLRRRAERSSRRTSRSAWPRPGGKRVARAPGSGRKERRRARAKR